MLAAILVIICGTSVFTSCTSDNDDNPSPESGANSELVGQWYSDVSGATYAAWTYGKAWQQTELKADGTGVTNIYYLNNDDAVVKAVEDGTLTEERINQSVRRILKLKKQAGHQTLL